MNCTPQNIPCVVTEHPDGPVLTTATFDQIDERNKRVRSTDRLMSSLVNIRLVVALLMVVAAIICSTKTQTFNFAALLLPPVGLTLAIGYLALRIRKFNQLDRAFNASHHLVRIARFSPSRAAWVSKAENLARSIHDKLTALAKDGITLPAELEDPRHHLNEVVVSLSQEWRTGDDDKLEQAMEQLDLIDKELGSIALKR